MQHVLTERLWAAKQLPDDRPGDRLHELNMLKHLSHPALPRIIDVLEDQESVWLIMDYISGRSLKEILAGELTAEQFFSIVHQLSEVLFYLHTRPVPVFHLDIKPANVLLREDGGVILIDFGAAALGGRERENSCFGTFGYAAPEQYADGEAPDARSDIYGFGALMYRCLYGALPKPWRGGAFRKPSSRHGVRKRWKKDADRILRRCLAEDRNRRYENSQKLYRAVCRMEKRYYGRRKLMKAAAALGLLIFVCLFAIGSIRTEYSLGEAYRKREVEILLERSEAVGLSQALLLYEEAVSLCPEESGWALHLLNRMTEDFVFSIEEEKGMMNLLYQLPAGDGKTALEWMDHQSETYGFFAYRLGLAYWYFYEGAGGKSAAARWFDQAAEVCAGLERRPDWTEAASIHAEIGGYYQRIGRQDEEGKLQETIPAYWQDMTRLWHAMGDSSAESSGVRRQVATELLSCVIMQSHELRRSGETKEGLLLILAELEDYLRRDPELERQEKEELLSQCGAARSAAERAYEKASHEDTKSDVQERKGE